MNKQKARVKKQILITIILILLIAIIGFNFDRITGDVVHQYPIVRAYKTGSPYQNELNAGEKLTVEVTVGNYCVDPEISFYFGGITYSGQRKASGPRLATVTKRGSYRICKGETVLDSKDTFKVEYKTRPVWDGDYYARVYFWKDRTTKDYLNVYFKVKPKK